MENLEKSDLINIINFYKNKISDIELSYLKLQIESMKKLKEKEEELIVVFSQKQENLLLENQNLKIEQDSQVKLYERTMEELKKYKKEEKNKINKIKT